MNYIGMKSRLGQATTQECPDLTCDLIGNLERRQMAGLRYGRYPSGRNVWDQLSLEHLDLFHLVVFARQDEGGDADIAYRG